MTLDVDHVWIVDDALHVLLPRGKEDQFERSRTTIIPASACAELCPVRAQQRWLERGDINARRFFPRSMARRSARRGRTHARSLELCSAPPSAQASLPATPHTRCAQASRPPSLARVQRRRLTRGRSQTARHDKRQGHPVAHRRPPQRYRQAQHCSGRAPKHDCQSNLERRCRVFAAKSR